MNAPHKRRKKLIKPALQFKVIGSFLGTAAIAVIVQTILMARAFTTIPELSDAEHTALLEHLPGLLTFNLFVSLAVLIPLILLIGITVTHRIVGPIYRFESYLGELKRGETSRPCRIRKGDELHDLCNAINQATEPLRVRGEEPSTEVEVDRAA